MTRSQESVSMALFCDFENVALGVRDANYEKFDIKKVLERLLLKGSIVVKKAYCDWSRYQGFKAAMHEASFELIDIPHVRQSGKNSADIRLVVDALDLCYTKSHVDTFVIISGDSDFSPLVSKLRENAKQVIGVGVKQSTSDLLIANCDEFIFYDDLVRESQRQARRDAKPAQAQNQGARRGSDEDARRRDELQERRTKAIDLAVETYEALSAERGDGGKIWASVLKEAIKRRRPDFNESYFGFKAFGNLLEAAQQRGLLQFGRDEKSGAYVYRQNGRPDADDDLGDEFDTPVVEAQGVAASPVQSEGKDNKPGKEASEGKSGKDGKESKSGKERKGRQDGQERRQARRDELSQAEADAAGTAATPAPVQGEMVPAVHGAGRVQGDAPVALAPAAAVSAAELRPAPAAVTEAEVPVSSEAVTETVASAPPAAKRARKQPARVAKVRARAAQQQSTDGEAQAPLADARVAMPAVSAGAATAPTPAAVPEPAAEPAALAVAGSEPASAPRKSGTRRSPRKRTATPKPPATAEGE